jgi:hypothetical protein
MRPAEAEIGVEFVGSGKCYTFVGSGKCYTLDSRQEMRPAEAEIGVELIGGESECWPSGPSCVGAKSVRV